MFWFRTNLEAPRGRLIAVDTRRPKRGAWRELINTDGELYGGSNLGNGGWVHTEPIR